MIFHSPFNKHVAHQACPWCESTWAEHSLNLIDELLCNEVGKAPHSRHPAFPLAGDAVQILILPNLIKHVSNTDGIHINTGISVHMHQNIETQRQKN